MRLTKQPHVKRTKKAIATANEVSAGGEEIPPALFIVHLRTVVCKNGQNEISRVLIEAGWTWFSICYFTSGSGLQKLAPFLLYCC